MEQRRCDYCGRWDRLDRMTGVPAMHPWCIEEVKTRDAWLAGEQERQADTQRRRDEWARSAAAARQYHEDARRGTR